MALSLALKVSSSLTRIDLDKQPKRENVSILIGKVRGMSLYSQQL